jgi:hypothetical protein
MRIADETQAKLIARAEAWLATAPPGPTWELVADLVAELERAGLVERLAARWAAGEAREV